jgi:glycosyltransferase involved in cell wall biosynthesis
VAVEAVGHAAAMNVPAEPRESARRTIRVALYYPWVYLTSGAERTVLELTGRSRHTWTVFTNRYEPTSTFPAFAERRVVELKRVSVKRSLPHVASAAFRILRQRLPIDDYDVLVVVCEGLGDLSVLRNPGRPAMCVCLTPLRAVFDPEYRRRARGTRNPIARTALSCASGAFAFVDRLAWRRYARVFCISEEVRDRVVRGRLAVPGKLEVLHVGLGFRPEAPSPVSDPFFLLPGRIMWTKNVELGVEAFLELRRGLPSASPFRLVVAGAVDRKSQPYLSRLRHLAAQCPHIEFVVAPTDAQLAMLYASCRAVLFPAFNEDWGMVPLEGMAFGKPVVATNRGGPRESVRHGVDGFLEEPVVSAFAARMKDLATDVDLAHRLGHAAFVRAGRFTWNLFVDRIDDQVERLAAVPAGRSSSMSARMAACGERAG